jgi:hypothetical protein
MANKIIVFIHGSDPDQADTPWMFYHLHPSTYTTPVLSEGKTFDLVYFDFEKGRRQTWKGWSATRSRKRPTAAPDEDVELTPKAKIRDQAGDPYPGSDPDFPSVLAFYDWAKGQAAGSIASIQIFSHAVVHQPVLFASSYEYGAEPDKAADLTAPRDPHDTEFRLRDFEGSNPLATADPWDPAGGELGKFRNALDADVFIKVWGCGEQTYSHNDGAPIRKLVTDYLKVKSGKTGDTQRATLLTSYLDHVKEFFPFRLAQRLQVPVWAGPVGWGSDPYDIDGTFNKATYAKDKYTWKGKFPPNLDRKELWWRVSAHFRGNKALAEKFFKKALKAKLDALGYVEYKVSWVNAATDAADSILNPPSGASGGSIFDAPAELMRLLNERIGGSGAAS